MSRVLDVKTRAVRMLPRAIGAISPDGKLAVFEDFRRILNYRQSVGYAGISDPYKDDPAPADIGVWRMDMDTGESLQLVSLEELVNIPYPEQTPEESHYVNHLSWNPSGERFLMFNRWFGAKPDTRVFTLDKDSDDLRLLSARGASNWTWRDPEHVLIWGESAYRLYRDDNNGEPIETLIKYANGHQSYVPHRNSEWLLTDTYPHKEERQQELYLYHIPSRKRIDLGYFIAPARYTKGLRCDLHPRLSRSGTKVVIDSPHEGNGLQMYLIDIRECLEMPI